MTRKRIEDSEMHNRPIAAQGETLQDSLFGPAQCHCYAWYFQARDIETNLIDIHVKVTSSKIKEYRNDDLDETTDRLAGQFNARVIPDVSY